MDLENATIASDAPMLERLYHVQKLWVQWAKELNQGEIDADAFGREIAQKLMGGKTEYFVITSGGKAVGFFEVTIDYDPAISTNVAFFERAYIVPECRGRGLFRKAVECLETWAIEQMGCKQAVLEVSVDNDGLIRFYEEIGFKVTHAKMRRIESVQ